MALIWSLVIYSELHTALLMAIVSLVERPLTQIRPFMPTAISYGREFPRVLRSTHSGDSILK